jgi:hypothetical protein
MVETAIGLLVRRIESASPLRGDVPRGRAAEEATRGAASIWGLPDFVFRPAVISVGSGSREGGDGLLIVGSLGVAIQVKAREGPARDEARERSWIDKHVARGLRQAQGTIRKLRAAPTELTNGRGRVIELDAVALRWIAVVVVDHPDAPDDIVPPVEGQPNPSLVLLRRDWEFLFDQLKSTHAVSRYLERVAGDPLELGTEAMRYFQLAQADERTPPGPADPRGIGPAAQNVSWPLLPYTAAAEDDAAPQTLVRMIFEDIAIGVAPTVSELERLRVLAALDTLPVQTRALVGGVPPRWDGRRHRCAGRYDGLASETGRGRARGWPECPACFRRLFTGAQRDDPGCLFVVGSAAAPPGVRSAADRWWDLHDHRRRSDTSKGWRQAVGHDDDRCNRRSAT